MEEYASIERMRQETRRRIAVTLAYPGILLALLLAVLAGLGVLVVPQFHKIFMDFACELPAATEWILWGFQYGLWWFLCFVVLVAFGLYLACTLPAPHWLRRIAYGIPLIGPVIRANGLVAFSRLMRLFIDQRVPVTEALRLTADGVRDPALAVACRRASEEVAAGQLLSESLAGYWQFPPTLFPFVRWGQQIPDLTEAFQAAAEMYEGRMRLRETLLAGILPPLAFAVIGSAVGFIIVGLFLPLISLIQNLT
jgi:type II secretory pathway component PulF